MARTKRPGKTSSDSPPSKKAKSSSEPRFRPKIQFSKSKSKQKGIVIKGTSPSKPVSTSVPGKGKGKQITRDADTQAKQFMATLDTAFQRFTSQSQSQGKTDIPRKSRYSSPDISPSQSNPNVSGGSTSTTPSQSVKDAQASVPPPNFIVEDLKVSDPTAFKNDFGQRSFCPCVYVDFEKLKTECNVDLSQYLGQFEPLLKIRTIYSPTIVKIFYFNMKIEDLTDQDDNVIEEVLTTSVRGKTIRLTADLINTFLGIEHAPSGPFKTFTEAEIFKTLKGGDEMGSLNFSPGSMKDEYRVVWYIYSRSLINKGKNYSHFTGKDFSLMTSIIAQEPRNIGAWILDEMRQFRFHSNVTSTIPFPSLISYILFLHNVWFLVAGEKPVAIERFGKIHLARMKISFIEGTGQSKPQKSPRMEPSPSKADEAQSSQAGSPAGTAPSFFKASIQAQFQEAIQSAIQSSQESLLQKIDISQELFLQRVQKFNEDLLHKFDSQIKSLVEGMSRNFQLIIETLQTHSAQLTRLETLLNPHLSSSAPSASPVPSSPDHSPAHVPTPSASTPQPKPLSQSEIAPEPEPTFTPTHHSTSSSSGTSSYSFDPMTALVVYSPSTSSFTFPLLFPDDKGGEA